MAFEVASVRPHQGSAIRSGPLRLTGSLIRLQGYTLFGLVMDAYGLRDFQLEFGSVAHPDEIYGKMYDITARAPGTAIPKPDDVRRMLQSLLVDRFQLTVHRITRERPFYNLVVGNGTAKLKESAPGFACTVQVRLAADGRNNEELFQSCSIEDLADRLGNLLDERPVLDKTGRSGKYDMRLIATPAYRSRAQAEAADIDPAKAVNALGLRLVATKVLIEVLVVDHVGKPTEN